MSPVAVLLCPCQSVHAGQSAADACTPVAFGCMDCETFSTKECKQAMYHNDMSDVRQAGRQCYTCSPISTAAGPICSTLITQQHRTSTGHMQPGKQRRRARRHAPG